MTDPLGKSINSAFLKTVLVIAIAFAGLFALALYSNIGSREASRRSACKNNLKHIGLALHNYHETYDSFPPAVTYDATGRPAHSWRVLILPFIEESELYEKYRFDEPWDGPNNSKLAASIPYVYRCASFLGFLDEQKLNSPDFKVLTNFVAIVGPDAVFGGDRATTFKQITDGTDRTLLVAETRYHAEHWMRPDDVTPQQITTELLFSKGEDGNQSNHPGGMHFAFADGRVRFIPGDIDLDVFRGFITRAGKEKIPDDF